MDGEASLAQGQAAAATWGSDWPLYPSSWASTRLSAHLAVVACQIRRPQQPVVEEYFPVNRPRRLEPSASYELRNTVLVQSGARLDAAAAAADGAVVVVVE